MDNVPEVDDELSLIIGLDARPAAARIITVVFDPPITKFAAEVDEIV
jgi:hypothetical protein